MSKPQITLDTINLFLRQQGVVPAKASSTLGVSPVHEQVTRVGLNESLSESIACQRKMILVPIALSVALFVMACILLFSMRDNPKMLAAIFAATGITLPWPIWWMTYLLKLLWLFEASAAAMPFLSEKDLAKHLNELLKKFGLSPSVK